MSLSECPLHPKTPTETIVLFVVAMSFKIFLDNARAMIGMVGVEPLCLDRNLGKQEMILLLKNHAILCTIQERWLGIWSFTK